MFILGALVATGLAGTLSVGIALQSVIRNVIAGVFIFIEKPFRIGDEIHWNGNFGYVENISLRVTRVRSFDNKLLTVPNSELTDGVTKNPVKEGPLRMEIDFPIDREVDFEPEWFGCSHVREDGIGELRVRYRQSLVVPGTYARRPEADVLDGATLPVPALGGVVEHQVENGNVAVSPLDFVADPERPLGVDQQQRDDGPILDQRERLRFDARGRAGRGSSLEQLTQYPAVVGRVGRCISRRVSGCVGRCGSGRIRGRIERRVGGCGSRRVE